MHDEANTLLQTSYTTPQQAVAVLIGHVERALDAHRQAGGPPHVQTIRVALDPVEPFAWLRAQNADVKMLWTGRGEEQISAAFGIADEVRDLPLGPGTTLQETFPLLAGSDARYMGGLRFDSAGPAGADWEPFGSSRFILPRIELRVRPEKTLLSCTLVLPRDARDQEAVRETLRNLTFPSDTLRGSLPLPDGRSDTPTQSQWLARVERALEAFGRTQLQKVVLARQTAFTFEDELDPFLLLKNLRRATPGCFHFCFQPTPGTAFIGASPERLFRIEDGRLETEAVAGTRPRGENAADDARLRAELLNSDKEQREHGFVKDKLRDELQTLCEMVSMSGGASDMELSRGRHLYAALNGLLREGISALDVLRHLHPTPAVGGTPTREAKQTIRRWESFDRGWYAGPVGWIGRDGADFAVAIRSALLTSRRLALFSGAGIVEGSQPRAEWDEIEHKIRDFVDVLGIRPHPVWHR